MRPPKRAAQSGVTLIELLVGLAIGLMAIAVALGALLVSRSVSGTVSDATQLQQQGAHALRVIGLQLRQAGSVRLNLAFAQAAASAPVAIDPGEPVAFETVFDRAAGTLRWDGTNPLQVGYQNYTETVNAPDKTTAERSQLSDCLGATPSATVIQSNFRLVRADGAATGELQCAGADGEAQTIVGNVADFQVRYLVQTGIGAEMQHVAAADAESNWPAVVAVEVCLELVGQESIDTVGGTFRSCSWTTGQDETPLGNRLHMVFRNTFQLRTQGAPR